MSNKTKRVTVCVTDEQYDNWVNFLPYTTLDNLSELIRQVMDTFVTTIKQCDTLKEGECIVVGFQGEKTPNKNG